MARKAFQRTQKNTSEQPCEYAPFNLKNMDYEKKYNDALNWMRELYPGLHGATKEDAEHYFPELRESENERMMRMIGLALTNVPEERFTYLGTTLKDCLAYLEKQKDHFRDDTKMVEQKSAENGVDVIKTSALLAADRLASAEMTGRLKERSEILENPEKYGLYKPAEWSEEDDWKRKELIQYLEEKGDYRTVWMTWLKSLRPSKGWKEGWCEDCKVRYNHWKPSEEQESVAERFARIVRGNLIGIDIEVQQKFEQLYFEITGNKMYGGYND